MHPVPAIGRVKCSLNNSAVEPKLHSTKLAAVMRGSLMVALFSALLLISARPVMAQTETALWSFSWEPYDGSYPQSSLTFDAAGNLYGTTSSGGVGGQGAGFGTVFKFSPGNPPKETVLYSFCALPNCADGRSPLLSNAIFDAAGNLYGTASFGGAHGYGAVFELSPAGETWTESVLYSFCSQPACADGQIPRNNLLFDAAGNLCGVNSAGVFQLKPSSSGWTEHIIYAVEPSTTGLAMDGAGNLYGVSFQSTLFELSPSSNGAWNPTVIYAFDKSDSEMLVGNPVLDHAGNIYLTMTTFSGQGAGALRKLSLEDGTWTKRTLEDWETGSGPWAGVVLDSEDNIYGTTGGGDPYTYGTVFELVAGKGGSYKKKLLWAFDGSDGSWPYASLTLDSAGNLYGTTYVGGGGGRGTIFEVVP
jgi:uncharacterized repeat protein (TIGR03803 family)